MRATAPIWRRFSRIATLLWVLWALAVTGASGEAMPVVLGYAAVFVILWVVSERFPVVRSHTIFAVASLAAPLTSLPFVVSDLSHPESPAGFILTTVMLGASLVGILVGIGIWTSLPSKAAIAASLAAAAMFLVGVMVAVVSSLDVTDDQSQRNDLVVLATGFDFRPANLTIQAGRTGFYIENRDRFRHTFTLDAADVTVELPSGAARRVVLDLEPGTYQVVCKVPGHQSMTIDLTVAG